MKKGADTEAGTSGNVSAIFLGMLFKMFFGLIWWVFMTLPIKTMSTSLIWFGSLLVLGTNYLYLLEEHMDI